MPGLPEGAWPLYSPSGGGVRQVDAGKDVRGRQAMSLAAAAPAASILSRVGAQPRASLLRDGASQLEFRASWRRPGSTGPRCGDGHLDEYVGLPQEHPRASAAICFERLIAAGGHRSITCSRQTDPRRWPRRRPSIARPRSDVALRIAKRISPSTIPGRLLTIAVHVGPLTRRAGGSRSAKGWVPSIDDVADGGHRDSVRQL